MESIAALMNAAHANEVVANLESFTASPPLVSALRRVGGRLPLFASDIRPGPDAADFPLAP